MSEKTDEEEEKSIELLTLDELREGLKNEWRIFCHEYVIDWNGTRSYKVAYPNITDDNTAGVSAFQLLRKPKIKRFIELIQKDLEKLCGVSASSNIKAMLEIRDLKKNKPQDKIRASEVINKMLGYNAIEKQHIIINQEQPLFPDDDV